MSVLPALVEEYGHLFVSWHYMWSSSRLVHQIYCSPTDMLRRKCAPVICRDFTDPSLESVLILPWHSITHELVYLLGSSTTSYLLSSPRIKQYLGIHLSLKNLIKISLRKWPLLKTKPAPYAASSTTPLPQNSSKQDGGLHKPAADTTTPAK